MARTRISWDNYFMSIAVEAATRATCDINPTGAVIVRDKNILCSGYTGSVRGLPHCAEIGHPEGAKSCGYSISGEINAIVQAAFKGINIDGAAIYTTGAPDWYAFQHIANAGIITIAHGGEISDEFVLRFAPEAGVDLVFLPAKII